ncbi:MAG: FtsX-like permease family protein [Gammaproteobacteria bacterium]
MSSTSIKLGYKYLRSSKGGAFSFTTFLAIIGLIIGISSLIVVTSVMNGFEKELENRILGVIPHAVITSDIPIQDYEKTINQIKENDNIIFATPYISIQGLITTSNESQGISIIGVDPGVEGKMSIIPEYTVLGSISDLEEDNTIIIGSSLAANIGVYIGDEVNITTSDIKTSIIGSYPTSVNLKIVGIYELKTEIDQFLTLISHKTAQKLKNIKDNETTSIRLKTNDLFNADLISRDILKQLNNASYSSTSWKSSHGTLFEAIKFEKLLISMMLFLIVFVASILVLSTVVMTVKSKEREIGILMTLGASSKHIILIFLTQGMLVSIIGIIGGILIGLIFTINLNYLIDLLENLLNRNLLDAYFINYFPYYIDYSQVATISVISFLISAFSSLVPSMYAIRLNPVEILRHE